MTVQHRRAELEVKFNQLTSHINSKWHFFNEQYFATLRIVSEQENARNTIINQCFSSFMDKIVTMGQNMAYTKQFKSKDLNDYDFFDVVLNGMPLEWLKQDIKELGFAETVSETFNRKKINYDDDYIGLLFNKLYEYRR